MNPDTQMDMFDLFAPSVGVHKSPPAFGGVSGMGDSPMGSKNTGESPVPLDPLRHPVDPHGQDAHATQTHGLAARATRSTEPATSEILNLKSEIPAEPGIVFERSYRATNYRLTLRRDGTAVATIPARGSEREARRFVAEHADWLGRARARQQKRPRVAAVWTIGTQILWRGEMAPIRVAVDAPIDRPAVTLGAESAHASDHFRVSSFTANLRPTLESHFLRIAKIELPARTWELATETRVPVTEVCVRNQRTRWGSCTTGGVISLNWRLVQTPAFVRDYIIYHELMHLREMNHSPRFWARVAEVCPTWQDAERWIKQNGGLLGL